MDTPLVKISGRLARGTGQVAWRFESVDPSTGLSPEDALAGFLPPNKVPPEGEGSVSFSARPRSNLETGAQIRNSAWIVFDANDAIVTPEWLNTIDRVAPVSEVVTLPDQVSASTFVVTWHGSDIGSGVRDYTIFVSENGGVFRKWLVDTPLVSRNFVGTEGNTYAFYSIARDWVGNIETPKNAAEASTTVIVPLKECGSDVTSSLSVFRSTLRRSVSTGRYVQVVTLRNVGGTRVQGPVSLVLDNLTPSVVLSNQSGVTSCTAPAGSPFVKYLGNAPWIQPSAAVNVVFEFENPADLDISYDVRVVAGPALR